MELRRALSVRAGVAAVAAAALAYSAQAVLTSGAKDNLNLFVVLLAATAVFATFALADALRARRLRGQPADSELINKALHKTATAAKTNAKE